MTVLDPRGDVVDLARAVCDVESVSGNEAALADRIEAALLSEHHLHVTREGNTLAARTETGRGRRVVVAGHIDTVPLAADLPSRLTVEGGTEYLWGRGSVDMKSGVAVQLALAAALTEPRFDVTWIFYDCEEVEAERNGLGRLARARPDLLEADFAVLCEPSDAGIEGGCNGTLRVAATTVGRAAHSARSWLGVNAIHAAAPILEALAAYTPATVTVDGLDYREGLNAVRIAGGVAGNVVPDGCTVEINYRFAPHRSPEQALEHVRGVLPGVDLVVTDIAPGARPGLDHPIARDFVAAVAEAAPPGTPGAAGPRPKYGWTDVARFSELGIPAVNFGPGDPGRAHTDDEACPTWQIRSCHRALRTWLAG